MSVELRVQIRGRSEAAIAAQRDGGIGRARSRETDLVVHGRGRAALAAGGRHRILIPPLHLGEAKLLEHVLSEMVELLHGLLIYPVRKGVDSR